MSGHDGRVGTCCWSSNANAHILCSGSRDRQILQRDVREVRNSRDVPFANPERIRSIRSLRESFRTGSFRSGRFRTGSFPRPSHASGPLFGLFRLVPWVGSSCAPSFMVARRFAWCAQARHFTCGLVGHKQEVCGLKWSFDDMCRPVPSRSRLVASATPLHARAPTLQRLTQTHPPRGKQQRARAPSLCLCRSMRRVGGRASHSRATDRVCRCGSVAAQVPRVGWQRQQAKWDTMLSGIPC
jgi:hypothetical protein